ncbi:hypothetical protein BCIN_02g06310 [Botrytis cinerea B05.10]|uniref:Fatty acid desaturase domain-containing protein n=2 Tax=Botryotinia fuckeliana TaxID=40559 RepID=A0A384JA59_BOTFB|nr:hypothetical protein BCIN_02g06310 [Botrytis cinerea B05.10]ATZ47341.1 hypothetical protein BCIN_02g06310 [Botrytis cinerea B05.10]CCD55780.1 similar to delta(12) fatty acid desaturase [Botrytis cinerea T4]
MSTTTENKTITTPSQDSLGPYGNLIDAYGNPFKVPEYTLQELLDAIPKHCFERSPLTSYRYMVQDLTLIGVTFYISNAYITPDYFPSWSARFALWSLYTIMQGFFGTGIWVVAHECNHQAFSPYKTLNDVTGWILHSAVLVPYFSWKIVHKQHHTLHNNLAKDFQFVPKSREGYGLETGKSDHSNWEFTEDTPLRTAFDVLAQELCGWPCYLMTNASGSEGYQKRADGRGVGKYNGWGGGVNHFDTNSPLFGEKDAYLVHLSTLGLALTISGVSYIGYKFGWINILVWYWIPYLWVNHWIVAIAYLHHTDPSLPKYQPEAWTYTRGAAATIDREFGFIGHYFLHDIIETHVLHHTVPTIPHYHAREATEAIKRVMGEHYKSDTKNGALGFLGSLWQNMRWCQWVEPCEGAVGDGKAVWFYRNSNHLGVPPSAVTAKSE